MFRTENSEHLTKQTCQNYYVRCHFEKSSRSSIQKTASVLSLDPSWNEDSSFIQYLERLWWASQVSKLRSCQNVIKFQFWHFFANHNNTRTLEHVAKTERWHFAFYTFVLLIMNNYDDDMLQNEIGIIIYLLLEQRKVQSISYDRCCQYDVRIWVIWKKNENFKLSEIWTVCHL